MQTKPVPRVELLTLCRARDELLTLCLARSELLTPCRARGELLTLCLARDELLTLCLARVELLTLCLAQTELLTPALYSMSCLPEIKNAVSMFMICETYINTVFQSCILGHCIINMHALYKHATLYKPFCNYSCLDHYLMHYPYKFSDIKFFHILVCLKIQSSFN